MSCNNKLSKLLLNSKLKIINSDYGIGRIFNIIIQDLENLIKKKKNEGSLKRFRNYVIPVSKNIKNKIIEFLEGIKKILTDILNKKDYISLKYDIEDPLINLFLKFYLYDKTKKNNKELKEKFKELFKDFIKYLFNLYLKDNFGFYINEKLKKLEDNKQIITELLKNNNFFISSKLINLIFFIIDSRTLVYLFLKNKKNNLYEKIKKIDKRIEEINKEINKEINNDKIIRINDNAIINNNLTNKNYGTILEQANSGSIIAKLLLKLKYKSPKYFDINYIASTIFLKLNNKIKKIITLSLFKSMITNIVNRKFNDYKSLNCVLFDLIKKIKYFKPDIEKIIYSRIALYGIIIDENKYNIIKKNIDLSINNNLKKFDFRVNRNINTIKIYYGLCELDNNILNIELICKNNNIKKYYFSRFALSYTSELNYNKRFDINKIYGIINTINFLTKIFLFENNEIKIKLSNIITIEEEEYNIYLIFSNINSKVINFNKYIIFETKCFVKLSNELENETKDVLKDEIKEIYYRPINNLEKKEEILNTLHNILLNDEFKVELINSIDKNKKINLNIKRDITKKEYIIKKSCLFNSIDLEYLKINVKNST